MWDHGRQGNGGRIGCHPSSSSKKKLEDRTEPNEGYIQ